MLTLRPPFLPHVQGGEDDGEDGGGGGGSSDAPKFLVFAHHKTVMNRLAAALEGATGYAPVGYVRIDGSTDPEDRCAGARLCLGGWGTFAVAGRMQNGQGGCYQGTAGHR